MAERVGFEPTVACATPVFKTGTFNQTQTSLQSFNSIAKSRQCRQAVLHVIFFVSKKAIIIIHKKYKKNKECTIPK